MHLGPSTSEEEPASTQSGPFERFMDSFTWTSKSSGILGRMSVILVHIAPRIPARS